MSLRTEPCPCCGSTSIYVGVSHAFGFHARCENCGLRTRDFDYPERCAKNHLEQRLKFKAAEAWNKRATAPSAPLVLVQLAAGEIIKEGDIFIVTPSDPGSALTVKSGKLMGVRVSSLPVKKVGPWYRLNRT